MLELKDPHRLEVYSETQRARVFVGHLWFAPDTELYTFEYDRKYLKGSAIPLGPDLPLRKRTHQSKKGRLFPSLEDRIPSRENPAYEEYCRAQGINPKEKNEIILLGTIGKRGPSTFIFEPVYKEQPIGPVLVAFRRQLGLTVRELSALFDLNYPTISRLETGKSKDRNTANLARVYITVPEAGFWCVKRNQRRVRSDVARRLLKYFKEKIGENQRQLKF